MTLKWKLDLYKQILKWNGYVCVSRGKGNEYVWFIHTSLNVLHIQVLLSVLDINMSDIVLGIINLFVFSVLVKTIRNLMSHNGENGPKKKSYLLWDCEYKMKQKKWNCLNIFVLCVRDTILLPFLCLWKSI